MRPDLEGVAGSQHVQLDNGRRCFVSFCQEGDDFVYTKLGSIGGCPVGLEAQFDLSEIDYDEGVDLKQLLSF